MAGAARAVHQNPVDSRNSPAKIPQTKRAAPQFSTSYASYAPSRYWKPPSYKLTAKNERQAIAPLIPHAKTQLGIHAWIVQRLSLRAISAAAHASEIDL